MYTYLRMRASEKEEEEEEEEEESRHQLRSIFILTGIVDLPKLVIMNARSLCFFSDGEGAFFDTHLKSSAALANSGMFFCLTSNNIACDCCSDKIFKTNFLPCDAVSYPM
ncbi:hypothetical protein T4D_1579 [Trichinella pseudospiralis]|uniref:Uncharacterized protein n=1 Tax=Trichinella pseudospiralis TaxID=6337 RepID=A0A0V1FUE3_TRIPS|nr:hypothetical protein T4D_1579 [Trichinella pseudospiralis]